MSWQNTIKLFNIYAIVVPEKEGRNNGIMEIMEKIYTKK